MSVRRAHNSGRNHLRNVVDYYQREFSPTSQPPSPPAATLPSTSLLTLLLPPNTGIGHEKAQSVIDSITNSYAAEGQADANPMLPQNQAHNHFNPPPFGFPPGTTPSTRRYTCATLATRA